MFPSKSTYVNVKQYDIKHRSHSIEEEQNPVWNYNFSLAFIKTDFLYFIIRHDGLIIDTDIAHGVIDLEKIDFSDNTNHCIPLFKTQEEAKSKKGSIIGNLYLDIKIYQ